MTSEEFDEQALIDALTAPGSPVELGDEQRYREMFRTAQATTPVVAATPSLVGHRAVRRLGAGASLAVVVALATGGVAAAYSSNLPDPVQRAVHSVLSPIGVPPAESQRRVEEARKEPTPEPTPEPPPPTPTHPVATPSEKPSANRHRRSHRHRRSRWSRHRRPTRRRPRARRRQRARPTSRRARPPRTRRPRRPLAGRRIRPRRWSPSRQPSTSPRPVPAARSRPAARRSSRARRPLRTGRPSPTSRSISRSAPPAGGSGSRPVGRRPTGRSRW